MTKDEYRAMRETARRLIELVGDDPFVQELLAQAEVEEAIAILRDIAAERHITLPASLAA